MNKVLAELMGTWKKKEPKMMVGILFNEPMTAYVVAEVLPTHQREAKFRKKPIEPEKRRKGRKAWLW